MAESFEELDVWRRSCRVAVRVFEAVSTIRNFGLKDQMERSAVSIASNIAEGSERPRKDFAKFIGYALGSSAELKTQLYIANKAHLIDDTTRKELAHELAIISRMLNRLRQSLEVAAPQHRKPR